MIGQQISLAKSRYTQSLECYFVYRSNQILWHIFSIVDADLYAIHDEMLTIVELHRIGGLHRN